MVSEHGPQQKPGPGTTLFYPVLKRYTPGKASLEVLILPQGTQSSESKSCAEGLASGRRSREDLGSVDSS